MKSLAAFLRAVGKQAGASLLSSVAEDKLKMAKVDEYYDQYIKDFPPDPVTKPEATQPPPKSANAATKRPTSTTTRSSALVQNRPKTQPIKPQIVRTEAPTLREQNGVTPARRPSAPIRPAAKPVAVVPKTLAAIGKPNHQPSARGKIESTETSRPVPKTIRRSEGPTLLQQRRMDSAPRISTIRPTPTRTLSAYRMSVDDPRRRDQSNRASTANASQTPSRRPTSVTRPISANVVNRPAPIKPNIVRMPTKPTETLKLTSTASESNRQTNGNSQQISQGGDVQQNEPARIRSALPAPRRSMLPTPSASIRPTNSQTKI
ncbi:hypothetical protein M3Y94_00839700 [Aphelenchoides besseyi]|nr:hypothetical protein M3Y94_00839700 [Aphelenchoides besseyi]